MSITSYAQNFEDVVLWRALAHITDGFYIDIGAQHPLIDSVSLAFHERGWHGIHVEPTPGYAELLRQQRLGDTVIEAAVSNGSSVLKFYEIADTGISTADATIAAHHRERGFDIREITVPSITLSAILDTCGKRDIHWIKIDVEGFEQQVLSSWGASAARPWIVVVESTFPLTQIETHESWEAILIAYGYTFVYFDGLNRYYVSEAHAELNSSFRVPPNVFDGFSLNGTASAPFHKVVEARYQEKISETLAQNEQERQSAKNEIERLTESLASLDRTHAEHEQNRAKRELALSEQIRQAKQELESLLHNQVQREQEVAAQLLSIQQQAAQEKSELLRGHSDQERALLRQYSEREQTLCQQLSMRDQDVLRLEHIRTERESEIGAQLLVLSEKHRQEIEQLAKDLSDREFALQRRHDAQLEALNQQLLAVRQEIRRLEQVVSQQETQSIDQIKRAESQIENLLGEIDRRDSEFGARLSIIKDNVLCQKTYFERIVAEQVQAMDRERQIQVERENTTIANLASVERALISHAQRYAQNEVRFKAEIETYAIEIQRLESIVYENHKVFNRKNLTFWRRHLAPLNGSDNATVNINRLLNSVEPAFSAGVQNKGNNMLSYSSSRIRFQPEFRAKPDGIYHISDFQPLYDRHFIRSAYVAILRREPDSEGEQYYLNRIRSGVSKTGILAQMMKSPEARKNCAVISGLSISVAFEKACNVPVVGHLLQAILFIANIKSHFKDLRALENHMFRMAEETHAIHQSDFEKIRTRAVNNH